MEIRKSGHNKFAGYYYMELGDFLPAVQTIFSDLGLCGVISFTSELATLRIVDIETEKDVSFTSPFGSAALKGVHEIQNIGAVETYQRRYLWVTALEIVEHDALEPGVGKDEPETERAPNAAPKPVKQAARLSEDDMDTVNFAMKEASELESLKNIFGPAFKKASDAQKALLKQLYDSIKTAHNWK